MPAAVNAHATNVGEKCVGNARLVESARKLCHRMVGASIAQEMERLTIDDGVEIEVEPGVAVPCADLLLWVDAQGRRHMADLRFEFGLSDRGADGSGVRLRTPVSKGEIIGAIRRAEIADSLSDIHQYTGLKCWLPAGRGTFVTPNLLAKHDLPHNKPVDLVFACNETPRDNCVEAGTVSVQIVQPKEFSKGSVVLLVACADGHPGDEVLLDYYGSFGLKKTEVSEDGWQMEYVCNNNIVRRPWTDDPKNASEMKETVVARKRGRTGEVDEDLALEIGLPTLPPQVSPVDDSGIMDMLSNLTPDDMPAAAQELPGVPDNDVIHCLDEMSNDNASSIAACVNQPNEPCHPKTEDGYWKCSFHSMSTSRICRETRRDRAAWLQHMNRNHKCGKCGKYFSDYMPKSTGYNVKCSKHTDLCKKHQSRAYEKAELGIKNN